MRRLVALIATALTLAGCGGGGGGTSSGPVAAPPASTLPTSGTVTYKDGRVYTVAPLHTALRLDDVVVRVKSVVWRPTVKVGFKPPGTTTYGLVTLTVTNLAQTSQKVALTQIWLRNAAGAPYLAAATASVPRNLLGLPIPAGKSVTGTLVYPAPQRETGYLLVYRFGDAKAIAKAKHVGLLAYP
ncbi:MAG: DUF4352 domain-containing protein [Gaiellales bacterium]